MINSYVNQGNVKAFMKRHSPSSTRRKILFAGALIATGAAAAASYFSKAPAPPTLDEQVGSGKVIDCKTPKGSYRFKSLLSKEGPFEIPAKELPPKSSIPENAGDCK